MSARLLVDGWHVLIGIETHAQIRASQKLFSRASTSHYTDPPNTHFNSVDAAFPGTLPRINPKCVLLAVRAALALNCDIHERSSFDRKHYFYPDLPSGYQITQHYSPFASGGYLKLSSLDKAVRVKQIQMEQVQLCFLYFQKCSHFLRTQPSQPWILAPEPRTST